MNTSAEAADQVVRMSLNGAEFALKVTGKGSIEAAKLLAKAKERRTESGKSILFPGRSSGQYLNWQWKGNQ